MSLHDKRTTRRAFFLNGSAALGAGVASTAGAALGSTGDALQHQLAAAADREAIRQLHVTWMGQAENQGFTAADDSDGVIHQAYRPNALQHRDLLQVSDDGQRAAAAWHVDVAVGTPLKGDSTVAQMARLQGLLEERHWESGRIDAQYTKSQGKWTIASLRYTPA